MNLREVVAGCPIKHDDSSSSAVDVATDFIGLNVLGLVYFLKFVFDLLIVRSSMISYGIIASIDAERIVDVFPGLVRMLREPARILSEFMHWSSQVLTVVLTFTVGIPRCEG